MTTWHSIVVASALVWGVATAEAQTNPAAPSTVPATPPSTVPATPPSTVPAAPRVAGPRVATVVQAVRAWTGPDNTRLVIDLSAVPRYRVVPDSTNRRLTVVIEGAVRALELAMPSVRDGAVNDVTLADATEGLRLEVAMVEWDPRFEVSAHEAIDGYPPRLIVLVARPGRAQREASERQLLSKIAKAGERVIVVDPGHGGEAAGAVGPRRTLEKDVTLAIARKLAQELQKNDNVRVVLTRTDDYDVPLRERYRVAERYQADAFVSIHANSSRSRSGRGTEVYFLSLRSASDEASKALADIENAADQISGVPDRAAGDLVGILFDLRQNEVIQQSSNLAESILGEIESARRLEVRGVKQAPFAVLKSPVVPSVLVETAFINNPEEARLLRDPDFQEDMAEQIARGVIRYLAKAPPIVRKSPQSAKSLGAGTVGQANSAEPTSLERGREGF